MELKPLKQLLGDGQNRKGVTNPSFITLLSRLEEHGEVFVVLQSGKTLAIHLGDLGFVLGDAFTVRFGNGEIHTFFPDQIVEVWSHSAGYES